MSTSGEDDLIARHFAPLAGAGGLGLRDDAALIDVPDGHELVVTCDALVAGVHFFADDPADAIAAKALRVNLSDLAAKGARQRGFVLALALGSETFSQREKVAAERPDEGLPLTSASTLTPHPAPSEPPSPSGRGLDEWLAAFASGLGSDIATYDCPLLGGDTVRTPGPTMISITAFGLVPKGRMVPRTGARPGDLLYVSGTIGDAALGLQARLAGAIGKSRLLARYLRPEPRTALAPALLACASGAMDVSDGLVGDLAKMMRVSGCSAEIEVASVPLSLDAAGMVETGEGALPTALTGGDDYEILASVPPGRAREFETMAKQAGVAVTRIGVATAGAAPPRFLNVAGQPMAFAQGAYSHF